MKTFIDLVMPLHKYLVELGDHDIFLTSIKSSENTE